MFTPRKYRGIIYIKSVTQYLLLNQNVMLLLLLSLSSVMQGINCSLKESPDQNDPPVKESSQLGMSISKILNSFFASGYDKRVRPNYGGKPVEVGVTMFIISISSVSEVNMDFTADFYFRQSWQDPRLSFTKTQEIENLIVGAEVADKIWVPDTFFANEKQAYFHKATTFNTFLRIGHMGDVFRSIRWVKLI